MCEQWGPTLVVAAETMTRALAQGPRAKETAILFGDGAGACLVTPGDAPSAIRDIRIASDATFSEALRMDFGSTLQMDGRTIIMHAVRKLARAVAELLEKNSLAGRPGRPLPVSPGEPAAAGKADERTQDRQPSVFYKH